MNSDIVYNYSRLCEDIRLILADFGPELGWTVIESAIKSQLNTTKEPQGTDIPPASIKHNENTRNLAQV